MVRLTRNDYEPDVSFFNKTKSDTFEANQTLFPAPDFVAEVLSPSTEARDRGVKLEDYARHEIQEYWIIGPDDGVVEQYILKDGQYALTHKLDEGQIKSHAVAGFSLPVRALFDEGEYAEALKQL